MATKMLLPLLGQTMEEGTIIKWFKQEGDTVIEGEPLLEVMTDKVNMEVEAPAGGVLLKILAKPDEVVPVQAPIAIIGTPGESIDDMLAVPDTSKSSAQEPTATPEISPSEMQYPPLRGEIPPVSHEEGGKVFASPSARRVAREQGIDIDLLAGLGTGPGGRIVEKDILDYAASHKTTPLADKMAADRGIDLGMITGSGIGGKITSEDVEAAASMFTKMPGSDTPFGASIPLAGIRKAVADNVANSARSAVHVTLVSEVDMTQCVALRSQLLEDIEKAHGVRISFTDIIVKAVGRAILSHPIVNSSIQGDQIIIHNQVNIGVAMAVEGGLVAPVVKNVPVKALPVISAEIKELVSRARSGKARGEDYRGGTFTITNLGAYGVDVFNPVIMPGQSAILGVCQIVDKPVVVDGRIEIRSMMNLCLSFDHRVMDGVPAAEFLGAVKSILEAPYLIMT
ncbi:MAG: dihydrolipoamide acetyltransferase family protein [Armatimonadetes bacterium]|nr:dihydrolipoamide acetyltransferase family protein [Armatimonadota bacterium]